VRRALTAAGGAVFFCVSCASSPAVAGMALPVIIRSGEKKLAKDPGNFGLALEAGSYCVMYANAFVQGPASMLPPGKYEKRNREEERAKKYYLRGVKILRDGLEKKYPGVNEAYSLGKSGGYSERFTKEDVPYLYWITAGTLGAYALDNMDFALNAKIPELTEFIKSAYELDPDFNNGALDDFFVLFYGSLPPALGGDIEKARKHHTLAVKKSGGMSAGVYVSAAEVFAVPAQDLASFKSYLEKALAVDLSRSKKAADKLANRIAQRKARFMLDNTERYITVQDSG